LIQSWILNRDMKSDFDISTKEFLARCDEPHIEYMAPSHEWRRKYSDRLMSCPYYHRLPRGTKDPGLSLCHGNWFDVTTSPLYHHSQIPNKRLEDLHSIC
jgi:hypothetical protein